MRRPEHARRTAIGASNVSEMLAVHYCAHTLQVRDDPDTLAAHVERWELGGARLDTTKHSAPFIAAADAVGGLFVTRMLSGTMTLRSGPSETRAGPGDTVLAARPGRELAVSVEPAQMTHVGLDVPLLQRVAGATVPVDTLLDQLQYGQLRVGAAPQWQRSVDYLTDAVLADPVARASPLLVHTATNLLAAALLNAFLPRPAEDPSVPSNLQSATVRRACAFIEANADIALTVADVARAVSLTPRALQVGFRRHLDTTPMAHLRTVRLARLHDDLRDADPGGDRTVTTLAARWALTGTAYARAYRIAYGELPSQTLRR